MHTKTLGATLLLLGFGLGTGCGDADAVPTDGPSTGGGGEGGVGGDPVGGGGEGGGCPTGSHEEGDTCVATLGAFVEAASISDARDHHVTFAATTAAGTFIYVGGGGLNMASGVPTVERASVLPDGMLGAWETLPVTLPTAGPMVVNTHRRVLTAGGTSGTPNTITRTASILDDGSLSEFQPAAPLNTPRFHGAAVLHNGWVYASGGLDASGTSISTIERISLDDAGVGEAWTVEAAEMPEQRSHHGLALDGAGEEAALYVTGGLTRVNNDFGNDVSYDTVLRSVIQADGSIGAWETVGSLPTDLAVHSSFVHAGQLYVAFGLENSASFVGTIRRATILDDGALGEWETLPSALPITRGHCHQTPIINGLLYSIAGTNNAGSQTNAYVAGFE